MLPQPQLNALPLGAHSLSALTDEALFAACGVRIAFTGREGGVSVGPYASLNTGDHVEDDPACVARNRALVLEALDAPGAPLIVPTQVHGTEIVHVDDVADAAAAQAQAADGVDAVVVRASGVGALLNFADCLPLIIVAPDGAFAVAHAGWRGALAGVAGKAARALAEREGDGADSTGVEPAAVEPAAVDPAGFNAYIGPHIRSECFETSEEIAAQFADAYGADVLRDSCHVDLSRVVTTDLVRAGLSAERIVDAGICTVRHSDRYFSYRAAGGLCGRHSAAAIRHAESKDLPFCIPVQNRRTLLSAFQRRKKADMTAREQYSAVAAKVEDVCAQVGRAASEVTLVAVSKTVGPAEVQSAIDGGARNFGENRPDQLMLKADQFTDVTWHFIGNIQSRRIRDIVGRAALIHSLFEERHARKIDEVARERGIVQDVLLEVNVSGEESKSGLAPADVRALAECCATLPNVRVRGLMTMAPLGDMQAARQAFAGLRELRDELQADFPDCTELSMGMTDDWPIAIEEGATIVRIGRAIFADA